MTFEDWYNSEYDAWLEGESGYALEEELQQAFEAGQRNCDCVHTDNSAVIERLQNENKQLKKQYEFLSNQICYKECVEVWGENDKLKEQIEKMKCCGNCKFCDRERRCLARLAEESR